MAFEKNRQAIHIQVDKKALQRNQEERDLLLLGAVEKAIIPPNVSPEHVSTLRLQPEQMRGLRLNTLEPRHIENTRALLQEIFSMDVEHATQDVTAIAERNPLSHIEGNHRYWVLEDKVGNVIGLTGMNDIYGDSPEHTWLGWFAVGKNLQGSTIGIILLEYTLANARYNGKKKLYILSDNHPSMVDNYKFYHREGCLVVATFDAEGIHKDAACDVTDTVLSALYEECAPYIANGVTWYIRKKDL